MQNRDVTAIGAALKIRGYHVSQVWLQDCIDYFRSEHNQYSLKQLEDFVCEQWLLADLREMEVGCFPPNLSNQMKVTLTGKMACQVESLQDIGHSAYSQIQRIRNVDTGNLELEDKTNQYQQAWEPKSNRMLFLQLCDGIQNVEAMEYKPIPQLKIDLIPGTKVVLKGPLQCRRGVILLESHNIEICGGEVDALVICNAYENILARSLKLPENPDPYRVAPQDGTQTAFPQLQPLAQHPAQPQASQHQPGRAQSESIQPQPRAQQTTRTQQIVSRPKVQAATKPTPAQSNTMNQQLLSWNRAQKPIQTNQPQASTTEYNDFPDDEDLMSVDLNADDWAAEMEFEQNMANIGDSDMWNEWNVHQPKPLQPKGKVAHMSVSCPPSNPSTGAGSVCNAFSLGPDDDDDEIFLNVEDTITSNPPSNTTGPKLFPLFKKSASSSEKPSDSLSKCVSANLTSKSVSSYTNQLKTGIKRPATSDVAKEPEKKTLFTKCSSQEVSSTSDMKLKTDDLVGADDLEWMMNQDFDQLVPKEEPMETTSLTSAQVYPHYISATPFVYLSQISDGQSQLFKIFRVKAAVLTVVEKLTISGDHWCLAAKISDGSANLTVRFSAPVLEEIIGMSAVSVRLMRKEMEAQPVKKEMVRKNFEKAQNRLISLNCLLDIEWLEDGMPVVVGVEEPGPSTVFALKARKLHER